MINRTVAFDDLRNRKIGEVLQEVVTQQEVLTVRLPEGGEVAIRPAPRLKPLPELEGYVPDGWKEALYE